MGYFLNRLREPSSWLGLALLLSQAVDAWASKDPVKIGAVVSGAAAVLLPDHKPAQPAQ